MLTEREHMGPNEDGARIMSTAQFYIYIYIHIHIHIYIHIYMYIYIYIDRYR